MLTFHSFAQSSSASSSLATEQAAYVTRATATVALLAGDTFAGRGYGPADGARRAAQYLAAQFRTLGLEPLGDSAGRSYYQHFPLPINTFPTEPKLVLDGRALRPGTEFILAPDCPSVTLKGKLISFDTTWFALDSVALAGRLRPKSLRGRVLAIRAQDERRLPKLSRTAQRWVASAGAVIVREPKKLTASLAREQARQPQVRVLDSAWVRNTLPRRAELHVASHFEPDYPAMNVIGRLRGNGRSDSVIVVTAHYDHLGQQGPTATFYGANDNASGTAMLLELIRHFHEAGTPRHDLIFIAFSAEEAGLVGSQWCAAHPPVPLARIRFLLNLDLEGFGDKGVVVVNATVHPRQFALLQTLNTQPESTENLSDTVATTPLLPLLKPRGRAANSDHFPFSERGVPAFFAYSLGGPGYYHDVRDRPATLQLADSYPVFRLFRRFLRALDAAQP